MLHFRCSGSLAAKPLRVSPKLLLFIASQFGLATIRVHAMEYRLFAFPDLRHLVSGQTHFILSARTLRTSPTPCWSIWSRFPPLIWQKQPMLEIAVFCRQTLGCSKNKTPRSAQRLCHNSRTGHSTSLLRQTNTDSLTPVKFRSPIPKLWY